MLKYVSGPDATFAEQAVTIGESNGKCYRPPCAQRGSKLRRGDDMPMRKMPRRNSHKTRHWSTPKRKPTMATRLGMNVNGK